MSLTTLLNLFFVSIAVFPTPPSSCFADSSSSTAYEILQSYDFPAGILPIGVTGYDFDESTGKFAILFNKTCTFSIDGYSLRYQSKITGVLKKDRLSKLSGVQVKILFLWLNIGEVIRDGDDLDFSVGIASADFPLDNFYESPQCGCGFNCNGGFEESGGMEFNRKRLVSSY